MKMDLIVKVFKRFIKRSPLWAPLLKRVNVNCVYAKVGNMTKRTLKPDFSLV